jgi:hypothetical protein
LGFPDTLFSPQGGAGKIWVKPFASTFVISEPLTLALVKICIFSCQKSLQVIDFFVRLFAISFVIHNLDRFLPALAWSGQGQGKGRED